MNDATIALSFRMTSRLQRSGAAMGSSDAEFARLTERSAFLNAEFVFGTAEAAGRPAKGFREGREGFSVWEDLSALRENPFAGRENPSARREHEVFLRKANSALRKALRSSGKPRGPPFGSGLTFDVRIEPIKTKSYRAA